MWGAAVNDSVNATPSAFRGEVRRYNVTFAEVGYNPTTEHSTFLVLIPIPVLPYLPSPRFPQSA